MGVKRELQRVVPALRVASYAASKPFYESLGFREEWTHHFEPGLPTFASMVFDGMEVFLTEHTGDCQPGGLVHFYVADVDALYDDFLEYGVSVEEAPNNGLGPDLRVMSVLDPDRNRLKFLTQTHWE
ncbi:glyoxalase [Pseudoduganella eburnea]|uniref:Bleomycin resistance protein n=1 Tax=Massilia eburnea TaxID=1776165 RepID=A0A6L6QDG3_9BURK|nr:glyoxalase superfamily protein [Massilia eburnea]MTW10230.1 glyoxalase [Massilia eburnea]